MLLHKQQIYRVHRLLSRLCICSCAGMRQCHVGHQRSQFVFSGDTLWFRLCLNQKSGQVAAEDHVCFLGTAFLEQFQNRTLMVVNCASSVLHESLRPGLYHTTSACAA